jgi:hypothetical protein
MELSLGTFGDVRLDKRGRDPRPDGVVQVLTTHAIDDAAAAWEIVGWYQRRCVIEQLFRVMKSQGLQLEACPRALDPRNSQLASAERLVKRAAVATKAAVWISN